MEEKENLWGESELINTIVLEDSIELVYRQKSLYSIKGGLLPYYDYRIYKIIYNVSEKSEMIFARKVNDLDDPNQQKYLLQEY